MKKIILLAIVAVMGVGVANAQDWNKGDWFTGAQVDGLGLSHKFFDDDSETTFSIDVNAGYFISNRFAVDAALGFGLESWKYEGMDESESTNAFTFGVGVRYYPVGNLFARVGFEGQSIKDVDGLNSYVGVTVGYDLFVSEKVFFTPAIYYKKGLNSDLDESNNIGLSVGIGVRF